MVTKAKPYSPEDLYTPQRQRVYRGDQLSRSLFPWEVLELDVFV